MGFYRDSFGDFWDSVGILEDFLGFSEYCLMDSMGFFGVLLGFYRDYFGDFWDSVGIFRIFDDILGSSGYCSMDSIGFFGILMGFTGFFLGVLRFCRDFRDF